VALAAFALLLLVPPSVFLWMFFTEGLFLALSMGAILAAEKDRPLLAGVIGIGVAATGRSASSSRYLSPSPHGSTA
jgi:hypothetical protein